MNFIKPVAFSLLALAALSAGAATAADYEPPLQVEEVPVEVGSGWYLRGDVDYAFKRSYKDGALAVDDSLFDNDLVGLGWVGPLDVFSASRKQNPISGSVGFGYHFNDWLRADINIGLLQDDKYSGTAHLFAGYLEPYSLVNSLNPAVTNMPDFGCLGSRTITTTSITTSLDDEGKEVAGLPVSTSATNSDWRRDCMVSASAKNTAWNGLVNGYIDLGTYAGFTPYVGAGVGLLKTKATFAVGATCQNSSVTNTSVVPNGTGSTTTTQTVDFACRAPTDGSTVASYSKTDYDFMYGLSAGVSYRVSKNTSLDLGYQYVSAPDVKYFSVSDDGVHYNKGYNMHQVKVGLRYDLW